jgi:hypothetical protein
MDKNAAGRGTCILLGRFTRKEADNGSNDLVVFVFPAFSYFLDSLPTGLRAAILAPKANEPVRPEVSDG